MLALALGLLVAGSGHAETKSALAEAGARPQQEAPEATRDEGRSSADDEAAGSAENREESGSWISQAVLVLAVVVLLVVVLPQMALLLTHDGRRAAAKLWYLSRAFVGVDVGWRGLVQLVIRAAVPAIITALLKGFDGKHVIHWDTFWIVFFAITGTSVLANLFDASLSLRKLFGPVAGWVWRDHRKSLTAALVKRISMQLRASNPQIDDVRGTIRELLDIVVLHVRDHRGSHDAKDTDVFANLLIIDGEYLLVVARDSMLHDGSFRRETPVRHRRSSIACGRAIDALKPVSIGDLVEEYPEGPKNKPYRSILALPLISGDGTPLGALSIDSSRPYFFQSFAPGVVENDLENSLQPYLQLLMLVLERFIGSDPQKLIQALCHSPQAEPQRDA